MRLFILNLCLVGIAFGQAPSTAASDTIPVIPAVLARSLDSKKVNAGDEVLARTTTDLMAQNKILIPQGAKVLGKVTQATARSRGDGSSSLGLRFERIQFKGGRTLALTASIQAIAAPEPPPPMDLPSGAGNDSMRDSSANSTSTGIGGSNAPGIPDMGTPPAGSSAVLTPQSTGVIGISDLQLASEGNGAVISSNKNSVKLESGMRILLRASHIAPESSAPAQ